MTVWRFIIYIKVQVYLLILLLEGHGRLRVDWHHAQPNALLLVLSLAFNFKPKPLPKSMGSQKVVSADENIVKKLWRVATTVILHKYAL